MASLSQLDKTKLEDLLAMGGGYVLDLNDTSFSECFHSHSINIDDPKYSQAKPSSSKANRLRGFWEQEDEKIVGAILKELIETAEYKISMATRGEGGTPHAQLLINDCKAIANRLMGMDILQKNESERYDFLSITFSELNFETLPVEGSVKPILSARLKEAEICLQNNASLAAIFLSGSILEGILLGVANSYPERFNRASSCPKTPEGGPKQFAQWSLAQLIDVSREIDVLGEDIKKFGHALRDFRNYIHPYEQMTANFTPDGDTAKMCIHVVKAAMNDVTKFK